MFGIINQKKATKINSLANFMILPSHKMKVYTFYFGTILEAVTKINILLAISTRKMKKPLTDQLLCLLCKGMVSLNLDEDEEDRFQVHMKSQHDAYFNLEFLKAACKMDKDEMTAVIDVMKAKDEQNALAKASQNNIQKKTNTLSTKEDTKNRGFSSKAKRVKKKIFTCSIEGCDKEFQDRFLDLANHKVRDHNLSKKDSQIISMKHVRYEQVELVETKVKKEPDEALVKTPDKINENIRIKSEPSVSLPREKDETDNIVEKISDIMKTNKSKSSGKQKNTPEIPFSQKVIKTEGFSKKSPAKSQSEELKENGNTSQKASVNLERSETNNKLEERTFDVRIMLQKEKSLIKSEPSDSIQDKTEEFFYCDYCDFISTKELEYQHHRKEQKCSPNETENNFMSALYMMSADDNHSPENSTIPENAQSSDTSDKETYVAKLMDKLKDMDDSDDDE